jgi:hypothetical protein
MFLQGIAHGCGTTVNIDQMGVNVSNIPKNEIHNLTRDDLSISPFLLTEFDLMISNNSYNETYYTYSDYSDDSKIESIEDLIEEKIPVLYTNSCPDGDCSLHEIYIRYENEVFSLRFSGYCT